MAMNNLRTGLASSLSILWGKKSPRVFLLFVTGFLLSQFFLLNFLLIQHPKGGWVTFAGSMPTTNLIAVILLALIFCLAALWRSAADSKNNYRRTIQKPLQRPSHKSLQNYSTPTTFTNLSPE